MLGKNFSQYRNDGPICNIKPQIEKFQYYAWSPISVYYGKHHHGLTYELNH